MPTDEVMVMPRRRGAGGGLVESSSQIRARMKARLREHIAASGNREALELFDELFGPC